MSDYSSNIPAQWTNEGFNTRFEQVLQDNKDYRYVHAYRIVEEEHMKLFGTFRYKSYESFRISRRVMLFGKP